MTAYGAVNSLRNTLENITRCPRFSIVGGSKKTIDVVHNELKPWEEVLERLDETMPRSSRKKVNALDGRIKEAFWRFEDSLESLLVQQIPLQVESLPEMIFIDLQSLQNDVDSLIHTLDDMKEEYIYEVENMAEDEPISSVIGFHGANSQMIGLSDLFERVKSDLIDIPDTCNHAHALYGTAGVGKTALAMKIYEDPEIQSMYECRAWVTVGRVPQPYRQISGGIRAQLYGVTQGDDGVYYFMRERLDGKNCLIVLDDVWENFRFYSLPIVRRGYRSILLTGRHRKMMHACENLDYWYEVRLLNEEESMELLCEKVFGDESCPPHLHKVATKIAKLCEGLPLMIVTVADILSKAEHNRDLVYWNEVAERRNSVFTDAYNQISEVLFPSYDYLAQSLKMPFLFMGVFPQDYDTPSSKVTTMLTAEGLWYDVCCMIDLAFEYSLVLYILATVDKNSSRFCSKKCKTYRLHSTWRHVCRGEPSKSKFYHVLNKLIDAEEEVLKGQRGLCLENSILFGIKEFRDLVRLNCASFARSLLFYGPYHRYPIPIDVGFKLLREIDALRQRFYTFPMEILSLVQLKYLALTCNGELPATISKLFNLQALIYHPHLHIKRCRAPSYIPIQIWDMKELRHIEILGKSLVAPSHVASLEKLSTLVGVNASICSVASLSRRIPNVKKLGIQLELMPGDEHNDLLSCFGRVSELGSLATLKLSITNPVVKRGNVFSVNRYPLNLPHGLVKLHLSGTGLPWRYMDVVGSLPSLEVLKLRSYAFRGSHWNIKRESFKKLEFLLIDESDLVHWKPRYQSFSRLTYLSMKHCYKLEEICMPQALYMNNYECIIEIELEDCNPSALTCATQFQLGAYVTLRVNASSSFYEKPTTAKFERLIGESSSDEELEDCDFENMSKHGEDDEE